MLGSIELLSWPSGFTSLIIVPMALNGPVTWVDVHFPTSTYNREKRKIVRQQNRFAKWRRFGNSSWLCQEWKQEHGPLSRLLSGVTPGICSLPPFYFPSSTFLLTTFAQLSSSGELWNLPVKPRWPPHIKPGRQRTVRCSEVQSTKNCLLQWQDWIFSLLISS